MRSRQIGTPYVGLAVISFALILFWSLLRVIDFDVSTRVISKPIHAWPRVKTNVKELFNNTSDDNCPDLRILILTMDRPGYLKQLLDSLSKAYYMNDRADVDVFVDKGDTDGIDTRTLEYLKQYIWTHGEFTIHLREQSYGLQQQWTKSWNTSSLCAPVEIPLILEDDILVSPHFYIWLKAAYNLYSSRPEVAGFTLQRLDQCINLDCRNEVTPRNSNLNGANAADYETVAYPLVGSWGFSPTYHHWKKFVAWLDMRSTWFRPQVRKTKPYEWYKASESKGHCPGKKCMWTMHHLYYTHHNYDKYTLYFKPPDGYALASNQRAKGIHFVRRIGIRHKPFDIDSKLRTKPNVINDLIDLPLIPQALDYNANVIHNTVYLAKSIQHKRMFVMVQFLNKDFITLTKNFICNLKAIGEHDMLEATLFIARDIQAFTSIRDFDSNLKVTLVIDKPDFFHSKQELVYGQYKYFEFMKWRTWFISKLLNNGINLFLTEADSFWIQNPMTKHIDVIRDEVVIADNKSPLHIPNGGFIYLKSLETTRQMWAEIANEHQRVGGNEQYLEKLVMERYAAANIVKLKWLPPDVVASGLWYSTPLLRNNNNAVILNNWIKTTRSKILRSKNFSQWYLHNDEENCMRT